MEIQVRNATHSDRQKLANLIHFEVHVHRHLDWKSALDWIDDPPYLIIEQGSELLAALACPPDLPDVAWLRLFATASRISPDEAWRILWKDAHDQLVRRNVKQAYALSLQDWFVGLLVRQSFNHVQDVVVLAWESQYYSHQHINKGILVRPMVVEDLPKVCELDNLAFEPEWQNSLEALKMAHGQASIATIAELGNEVIGYQISTTSPMGGHLARLAVHPASQGQGVGTALVSALLEAFYRRGIQRVTVNTQANNQASLAIYLKSGFRLTNEVYPVFRLLSMK